MNRVCFLIPVYNHGERIGELLDALAVYNLPCVLVDDGSESTTHAVLQAEVTGRKDHFLLVHKENCGKGAAIMTGFQHAFELGFTHALQIDGDYQHDPTDVPRFLAAAEADPTALVLGTPLYQEGTPKHRYYGRYISRFWVWVETLSFRIGDPLVGYRLYPLAACMRLLSRNHLTGRMSFDPEIVVRLDWMKVPIVNIETKVCYPEAGVSNFRMIRDNLGFCLLHTRLICGMLRRLPWLLTGKPA